MAKNAYTIIHLGGSLVVPHISDEGGMDVAFLQKFHRFLKKELKKSHSFIVVVGGGKTARAYQKAASKVVKIKDWDLDWFGIHATRLNAHLLRTVFEKEAYPVVIDHDLNEEEVEVLRATNKKLFFASGWRPGWSTDYIAVRLAEKFGAKDVVIAKDTPFVYTKDPRKDKNAKPIKRISWKAYKNIIPKKWSPGLSSPVDPVATRLAEKLGIKAKILQGKDLQNFEKAIEGKPFLGTLIS
ncbi:MAG: UMP kinase [Candidatus Wildermuthbacteria bacterium]|nr:UMP kinase [Candidatus Wildermuthbacteria bacterium]